MATMSGARSSDMGPSFLDGIDGYRTQVAIWGYAVQGDVCETAAIVAEKRDGDWVPRVWDRKAVDLAGEVVAHGDEPYRRVKDWAALPWVGEHMVREHEAWAGL